MHAATGRLSFDDPTYGMLRIVLNGVIRGSSVFTIVHVLLAVFVRSLFFRSAENLRLDLVGKIQSRLARMEDNAATQIYRDHLDAMFRACAAHLLRSSILAVTLPVASLAVVAVRFGVAEIWNSFVAWGQRYANEAAELDEENAGRVALA